MITEAGNSLKNSSPECSALCTVEGLSRLMYFILGKIFFNRLDLPVCLGPVSKMTYFDLLKLKIFDEISLLIHIRVF